MKYELVTTDNAVELEKLVNEHLNAGWICQGGASVCAVYQTWENTRKGYTETNTDHTFAQAMVHFDDPSPPTAERVLDVLKVEVEKLSALLSDQHPELISWSKMTHDAWKKIAELYEPISGSMT